MGWMPEFNADGAKMMLSTWSVSSREPAMGVAAGAVKCSNAAFNPATQSERCAASAGHMAMSDACGATIHIGTERDMLLLLAGSASDVDETRPAEGTT